MKSLNFLIVGSMLISGCSSLYPKVEMKKEDFAHKPLAITLDVPFVEQDPRFCGPTALYMVTKKNRPELTVKEVTAITMTPGASGTYKQDMLAAARRLGMTPYKVDTFSQMIEELSEQKPIVLFHRTKFLWKDLWHYSVVTGYNQTDEIFYVNIGPYQNHEAKISYLIGSWVEGGSWAYVILPPTEIPGIARYDEALENAFAFLRLGQNDAAYDLSAEILKRWPDRYEADVVMAEALLKKNEASKALLSLKRAFSKHPENLALKQKIQELSPN